jgi:hypothetical protein
MTVREPQIEDAGGELLEEGEPALHRQHHATFLGLSVLVVVMAYLLVVVSPDRVAFRGFESSPLPHSCAFRVVFGRNCPGCGLTRGTIYLANGRFADSFAMHRLAWLFVMLIVAQIPYRLLCLTRGDRAPFGHRLPSIVVWTLMILMVGNWLLGFALGG